MATVQARLSLSMYDNIGGKANFLAHANVVDTTTLAAANAYLATLATQVATVSSGGVAEGTFTVVNKAIAAAPGADANAQEGANYGFLTAGNTSRFGLYIPSFLDSLIAAGGHIDITAGAAGAMADFMVAAVLGGNYANNAYVNYSAKKDAFRSNRKLRKRIR